MSIDDPVRTPVPVRTDQPARREAQGPEGVLALLESSDPLERVVPVEERDGPVKMSLLWITFQASVSNMYTGYLARSAGMSLGEILWACLIGVVVMVGYGMLAANVGTRTGQPHSILARGVLGKSGSALASLLLIVTGMGWYGFQAVFLTLLFNGLFGLTHLQLFCGLFALVMIANNLLGFRSVSAYARYIAAPVLLAWGLYAIIKAFASASGPHLFAVPHVAATQGILFTAELLIGVAMFGNEPDIFRYARRDKGHNIVSLTLGYGLGMLIFPVAGYLMAELSSASTLGSTMHFFTTFSLFGLTALAAVVFTINLFALNDANLYEAVNATQNFLRGRRRVETVIALGVVGAVVAVLMERSNSLQSNFFIVANMCAVFLPCCTIVLALDVFLLERLSGCHRLKGTGEDAPLAVTSWEAASPGNLIGIVAILAGLAVGAITGGLIPGTAGFGKTNVGLPALEAWLTASAVYIGGMLFARVLRSDRAREIFLGLPSQSAAEAEAEVPVGVAVDGVSEPVMA
ncbi:MAG TPA: cytosine permease [Acidimicrobiales bacterium]|jgi:purine-cytosine permease-like protein|nr:cytosine permease [Acidimicrobiales bacterium]